MLAIEESSFAGPIPAAQRVNPYFDLGPGNMVTLQSAADDAETILIRCSQMGSLDLQSRKVGVQR